MKYLPKYTREREGVSIKENLVALYSYADNQNIEHEYVYSRIFVQILDGEAWKWFRSLAQNSVTRIDELEEIFVKHWGDRKDCVYYLTEFGTLKKKEDEYLADFTKRFNKIY